MDSSNIDFAFKYPFSPDAKLLIEELQINKIEQKYIAMGSAQLEEALNKNALEYINISYTPAKIDFVIAYAYSRMLVSVLRNPALIQQYARAHALRSAAALEGDNIESIIKLSAVLKLRLSSCDNALCMNFVDYIINKPRDEEYALANMQVSKGLVMLDKHLAIKILEVSIARYISSELTIKQDNIPKAIVNAAKNIKLPVKNIEYKVEGKRGWIDKLLEIPIADCRHRTVNLILAPYLVNVRGLDVEKASNIISKYIQLCKTVNPDTKIDDRYIKYQCEYAKKHSMKPLSLKRARAELSAIDFSLILGSDIKE
ncbi:MAG: DNA primase noncatalytic subunit PriX [Candidatus Micrarchaeia archaeon]